MHDQIKVTLYSAYLLNNENYNSVSLLSVSIDYDFMNSFCRCLLKNVNFRDYHGDFLVIFPRFSNCFSPFPLVFLNVSVGVSMIALGASRVSPQGFIVSYFRFWGKIMTVQKVMWSPSYKNIMNSCSLKNYIEIYANEDG